MYQLPEARPVRSFEALHIKTPGNTKLLQSLQPFFALPRCATTDLLTLKQRLKLKGTQVTVFVHFQLHHRHLSSSARHTPQQHSSDCPDSSSVVPIHPTAPTDWFGLHFIK